MHEFHHSRHGIQEPQHTGRKPLLSWPARCRRAARVPSAPSPSGGSAQPRPIAGRQPRPRALSRSFPDAAAFQPRVVIRAHPGELRHFLTPQPRHTPQLPVAGDARLFRGDLRAPRHQELTDFLFSVHIHHATQAGRPVAVSVRHPHGCTSAARRRPRPHLADTHLRADGQLAAGAREHGGPVRNLLKLPGVAAGGTAPESSPVAMSSGPLFMTTRGQAAKPWSRFGLHDLPDAVRPIGFQARSRKPRPTVVGGVSGDFFECREGQPVQSARCCPAGRFLDEGPANTAAGVSRVDGHLLDVREPIDDVEQNVSDRFVRGIGWPPRLCPLDGNRPGHLGFAAHHRRSVPSTSRNASLPRRLRCRAFSKGPLSGHP